MLLQPAFAAADYLDEAVQALQGGTNVYVSPLVGGIDLSTQQQLVAQADQTNTAVVILPTDAINDIGEDTSQFIADIARRTGHDTVVVAFGKNLEAGSSVLPSGLASQLANQAEAGNGSTGGALIDFVKEVGTAQAHGSGADNTSSSGSFGIVIGLVLFMAVIIAGAACIRSRFNVPKLVAAEPTIEDGLNSSLFAMRNRANRIENDQSLQAKVIAVSIKTGELVSATHDDQPDKYDQTVIDLVPVVEGINNILDMYLKSQANSDRGSSSDAQEVRSATHRIVDDFADKVRQDLSRTNVADMIAFKVQVELLGNKLKTQTETKPGETP